MSETDEEKNQKFVLVKWLNPRFFQRTCTLSFLECYSLGLHQKLCNKIWQQFQLGTWTILPKWRFSESFSSRLEHGLPKLYFIRSFILQQVKRYTLQVYFVRLLIKIVTLELNQNIVITDIILLRIYMNIGMKTGISLPWNISSV